MQAQVEDPKLFQERLRARMKEVGEHLNLLGTPPDEDTLTALALLLVQACVFSGVKKSQFLNLIREEWRSSTTKKQRIEAMMQQGGEDGDPRSKPAVVGVEEARKSAQTEET